MYTALMPFPAPFGLVVLQFTRVGDPERMVSTFGVKRDDDLILTLIDAQAINAAFTGSTIMANAAGDNTYVGLTLYAETGIGQLRYDIAAGSGGGAGGTSPPQNTAYLVKKSTLLGGRKFQGRMYIPAVPPETNISGAGVIDAVPLGNIATDWTAFRVAMAAAAGSIKPYLFHADATPPTEILEFVPQALVATQRRRLRR